MGAKRVGREMSCVLFSTRLPGDERGIHPRQRSTLCRGLPEKAATPTLGAVISPCYFHASQRRNLSWTLSGSPTQSARLTRPWSSNSIMAAPSSPPHTARVQPPRDQRKRRPTQFRPLGDVGLGGPP